MSSYFGDNVYEDVNGAPGKALQGVEVWIYDQTGAVASLTDGGGNPVANPVLTDASGAYGFYAADGLYRADFRFNGRFLSRDNQVPVGVGIPLPNDVLAALGVAGGSSLVGFTEGGSGAATTTVAAAIALGPLYTHLYGVRASNSAAVNVTNLNALIARATATGREIVVTEGGIPLNANIPLPVGYTSQVSIRGLGWGTGFTFTGAAVTQGFYFNGSAASPNYAQSGGLYHMLITCTSGAERAATFLQVANARVDHVYVQGAAKQALYFYNALVTQIVSSLFLSCGSATTCGIEVSGDDASASGSTTFYWLHSYVNGGQAAGGTGVKGGVSVDRCNAVGFHGGAIESTGTPIIIGGQASGTRPVGEVDIGGAIDLENPGNGRPYIDLGAGWTGSPAFGVANIRLGTIGASPTGTTAMPCAARFKHCIGIEISSSAHLAPIAPTSQWEFVGTTNAGIVVRANRVGYGNGYPWVRVNSSHERIATPAADWNSLDPRPIRQSKTVTGTAFDASLVSAEGGIYGVLKLDNGSATNVTNITFNGAALPQNTEITLIGDGFSTLKQAAGGTGQLLLRSGADTLLGSLQAAKFIVDDAGRLREV